MKELYDRIISIVSESSNGKTLIQLSIELDVPIIDIMDYLMVAVGFKRLFAVHSGNGWTDVITYTATDHKLGIANHSRCQLLIANIRLGQKKPDVVSEREWNYLKDLCRLCGEIN